LSSPPGRGVPSEVVLVGSVGVLLDPVVELNVVEPKVEMAGKALVVLPPCVTVVFGRDVVPGVVERSVVVSLIVLLPVDGRIVVPKVE